MLLELAEVRGTLLQDCAVAPSACVGRAAGSVAIGCGPSGWAVTGPGEIVVVVELMR